MISMINKESCFKNIQIQLRALIVNNYLQSIAHKKRLLKPKYSYILERLYHHPYNNGDLDLDAVDRLQKLDLVYIEQFFDSTYVLTPIGKAYVNQYLKHPKLRLFIQWILTILLKKLPLVLLIILLIVSFGCGTVRGVFHLSAFLFGSSQIYNMAYHPVLYTIKSLSFILVFMAIIMTLGFVILLKIVPWLFDHLFYKKRIWDGFFLNGASKYNLIAFVLSNAISNSKFDLVYQKIRYSAFSAIDLMFHK